MTCKAKAAITKRRGGATFVASGIFLSRIAGLIRERAFAHYFGNSEAADVFRAALKIPNLLQNLFGEGALSASFVPVYASLAAKDPQEAKRLAGCILTLLGVITAVLVLLGIIWTPLLVNLITPGFDGDREAATIRLVRILFPGMGLLVMSAFCLGVLNSHRRFFVPYVAPVLWNAALIVTLIVFQDEDSYVFVENLAWGAVAGSLLQLAIQVPILLPYLRGMRLNFAVRTRSVRTVITRFVPNAFSHGIIQISAFIEAMIASFLPIGALAALGYSQLLYTLPSSLFGSSVAAAGLVDMSTAAKKQAIEANLTKGIRYIAFFVLPSAIAFVLIGDVLAGILFETGRFQRDDTIYVWILLAASALGLSASTQGRLLNSTFFALRDTRVPLYCSIIRVSTSSSLALALVFGLPLFWNFSAPVLTAAIPLSTSVAAVIELGLLRKLLFSKYEIRMHFTARFIGVIIFCALVAGLAAALVVRILEPLGWTILWRGLIAVFVFGLIYLSGTVFFKVEEARLTWDKIMQRIALWSKRSFKR